MSTPPDDFDFGFSFEDSEPIATTPTVQAVPNQELLALQEKVDTLLTSQTQLLEENYRAKLKEVEGLILPLLYNLMKNPDKPYIKWENRTTVIQKQIEKILAVTRS